MSTKREQTNIQAKKMLLLLHRAEMHHASARSAKKLCVESIRLKLVRLSVHTNARHEPTFNKFVKMCTNYCVFQKDKCKFKSVTHILYFEALTLILIVNKHNIKNHLA